MMSEWILSSCILIAVVVGIRYLFRGKIPARMQYALWALVLVRLLIPLSVGNSVLSFANWKEDLEAQTPVQAILELGDLRLPTRSYEEAYREVVEEYTARGTNVDDLRGSELEALEYEAQAKTRGARLSDVLRRWAVVVWCAGMAGMGGLFLLTDLRFFRSVKRSRKAIPAEAGRIPVYVSDAIDTPCLFGLFRPGIYVTREVAENPTLLHHAVVHEQTHFYHGDHIWARGRVFCLCLHWYNPLVWLAAFLSRRDGEMACDEAAIRTLGESQRGEYGRTLIRITCDKRDSLLRTATTMTGDGRGIRERIVQIARGPKTAVYAMPIVLLIAVFAVGCTFTGAKNDLPQNDTPEESSSADPSEETEPVSSEPEETQPAENVPEFLHREPAENGVSIAVLPTAFSSSGEDYRFLIPTDGEKLAELYDAAVAAAHTYTQRGDAPGTGWRIVCENQWWQVMEDGSMYSLDTCIDPKDAQLLFDFCAAAVADAGLDSPVRPESITGIRAATLEWNGTHTLTDAYALSRLEAWFQNSTELSGASCWFDAELTLTLENGESRTVRMATDDCATWMSEGVAYSYGEVTEDGISGNEEFYSFFSPELIHRIYQEDITLLPEWMEYMNWWLYAKIYPSEETMALMDWVEAWTMEKPADRLSAAFRWLDGVDGAFAEHYGTILDRFYQAAPEAFSRACLQESSGTVKNSIIAFLSMEWDTDAEQVIATLENSLPEA